MKTRTGGKSLKRIAYIPVLTERAQYARTKTASKVFADPHLHRAVTNRIFTEYLTSPGSPREWAEEFVKAYKHLLDGGAVTTMPAPSLDPDVVFELEAMIKGDVAMIEE